MRDNLGTGFSGIVFFNCKIDNTIKSSAFEVLKELEFLGYDYDAEQFVNIDNIKSDFLIYPRYSFRFLNLDFNLSCEENDDFMIFTVDNGEKSLIVENFLDRFISKVDQVKFAEIDVEGGLPNDLRKSVESSRIDYIFKMNYFGANYIEHFGKNFFDYFPGLEIVMINSVCKVKIVETINDSITLDLKNKISEYIGETGVSPKFIEKDLRFD